MGVYFFNRPPLDSRIEFDLAVVQSTVSQPEAAFYYSLTSRFSEKQSLRFPYQTEFNGEFVHYSIPLPTWKIRKLRFDPLPDKGVLIIKNVVFHGLVRKEIHYSENAGVFLPLHSIQLIKPETGGVKIVSNGSDPYLLLSESLMIPTMPEIKDRIATLRNRVASLQVDKVAAGIVFLILFSLLVTRFSLEE